MNYEQRSTVPPQEYFAGARSLGEVLSEYERLTLGAVVEHQARFVSIVPTHEAAFAEEARTPNSKNIYDVMQSTQAHVQWAVEPVVGQVDGIVRAAAAVIPTMLDTKSQLLLRDARSQAAAFGINSRYVTEVLDKAPRDIKYALKAALDAELLANVRSEAKVFGVNSHYVAEALNHASLPRVRGAMIAALDLDVFARVQSEAKVFGVNSHYVAEALDKASTTPIKAAMRAALDIDVLTRAQTEASAGFDVNSKYVKDVLDWASSKTVRAVLERQIAASRSSNQRASNHGSTSQNTYGGTFNAEDILGAFFRRNHINDHRQHQQTQQPRGETAPPNPKKDVEVEAMVAHVILHNKQYSWLRHESHQDIRRIINTVRKLRADAEAAGKPLSDRKVYLKCRADAETEPKYIKSVQILEALMGGDLNGKLPF